MRSFLHHFAAVVITVSLFSTIAVSQGINNSPTNVIGPLSFSRIGISEWASGGVRTVETGSPAAIFNNPALLKTETFSVYTEFGKRSETDYIADLKFDGQFLLPNFGQISASFDNIHVALGYTNLYNKFLTSEEIPVTTVENPEGTGESFTTTTSVLVHSATASVSYFFGDDFSVGITAGMNIVASRDEIWKIRAEGSGTGMILIAGFYSQPIKSFHLGGSLQFSNEISYRAELDAKSRQLLYIDTGMTGNNSTINGIIASDFPFTAKFPLTAQIGLMWDIDEVVSVMAGADFAKWTDISSDYDNTIDGHVGIVFKPLPVLKIRGGYFTQTGPAKPTTVISIDQTFLTAGIEWNALPGITIMGSIIQGLTSEIRIQYLTPPKKPFHQDLYQLGLLFQL